MDRIIYIVSPYYNDGASAAARYLTMIADTLCQEYRVCRIFNSDALRHSYTDRRWKSFIQGLIGSRIWYLVQINLLLMRHHTSLVITDINPCVVINSNKVAHIIHHIGDFPSVNNGFGRRKSRNLLSNLMKTRRFQNLAWYLNLRYSPRLVVAVSDTVASRIQKISREKKITVIRNKNQLEQFAYSRSISNIYATRKYDIVMIGNNIMRKNYQLAVSIINELSEIQTFSSLSVCIIGNDVDQLRKSINRRVSFTALKNISEQYLAQILNNSKIFVSTSVLEGYCIPYIEAQSMGIYCVVPNNEVFIENRISNGVLFCELSKDQYIDEITKILMSLSSQQNANHVMPSFVPMPKLSQFLNETIEQSIKDFAASVVERSI